MANLNVNGSNGVDAGAIEKFLAARGEETDQNNKLNAKEASIWNKLFGTMTTDEKESFFPDVNFSQTTAPSKVKRSAGNGGDDDGNDNRYDFSINIQIGVTMVTNINIDLDPAKFEEMIKNIINSLLETAEEDRNTFINQLVTVLVDKFADNGVDLSHITEILEAMKEELQNQGETLVQIEENQQEIINTMTNLISGLGKSLGVALDIIIENQNKSFEELVAIYDALKALKDEVGKLKGDLKVAFEQMVNKFDGDIAALIVAINAVKEAGKENAADIINAINDNSRLIQDEIKNLSAQLGDLEATMKAEFEELAGIMIANGAKLDDLKALLEAIKKDTSDINVNVSEMKEVQKEILEVVKSLKGDFATQFAELIAEVKTGNMKLDDLKALLAAIKDDTGNIKAELKEHTELLKKILEAIGNLDVNMTEGLTAILNKITSNPGSVGMNYTEILNLILDKLGDIEGGISNNFATLFTILGNNDNIDLDDLKAFLNEKTQQIIDAINDHDVNITVDLTGEVTCNCTGGSGGKDEGIINDLENILNAKPRNFDTTGVPDVQQGKAPQFDPSKPAFDLSGRRVEHPVPGNIYIQNGVKVLYR